MLVPLYWRFRDLVCSGKRGTSGVVNTVLRAVVGMQYNYFWDHFTCLIASGISGEISVPAWLSGTAME